MVIGAKYELGVVSSFGDRVSRASDRYPAIYYEDVGKAIAAQIPLPDAIVLDYACGAAPAASLIAEHCATVYLYDPTPKMQTILRQRYAANPKIKFSTRRRSRHCPMTRSTWFCSMVCFNI